MFKQTKYVAIIGGSSFGRNAPQIDADTIRMARAWAEEYGTTADYCYIYNRRGRLVAAHHRDTRGKGDRWFKRGV